MKFNASFIKKRAILKSLVDMLQFLVIENKIMGFISLQYDAKNHKDIIKPSRLGCIWNLIVIALCVPDLLEMYQTLTVDDLQLNLINKTTRILLLLASLIYATTCGTCGILHRRNFVDFLYKIGEIDHRVHQYFCDDNNYGPSKPDLLKCYYEANKRSIIRQLLLRKVFLIFMIASTIWLSLIHYKEGYIWSTAMRFLLIVKISSINHLMLTLIQMIKHRFALINEQLVTVVQQFNQQLDHHGDATMEIQTVTLQLYHHNIHKERVRKQLTPDCDQVTLTLCKISDLHHQLSKIIKLFNDTFGVILLVTFGVSFLNIVLGLFFLSANLQAVHFEAKNVAACIIYTSPFIFDLVYLCGSCYGTIQEANRSGELIHKIGCEDHDVIDQIEMFSLQIVNEKNEFNASGFFPVDYTLLFSIIGGVTTYIIILIQLSSTVMN